MAKKKSKKPKFSKEPKPRREPRVGKQFSSDDAGQVVWSFSLIDCEGPWGFKLICRDALLSLITEGFKGKEGLNWAILKTNGCHNVFKSQLVKNAQKRLEEIKLDDLDELFSMRFTGRARVWGIRDGNIFKILWWDPEHQVCPSSKKHT
ncbi:hypothetical protein [Legionella gresilensis]|uniref:hypothetical protein n=1 Tax=Legionella gresilensis TaxID=91823 RepID=UPI001041259C|nr:hypothetical protein [Legionella gresilensis]